MEIAYVALAISLLCNVAAAIVIRRALPAAIVRDHGIIRTEIERVHDAVEGLQTRWASKVIELTSLADECANYMERAEKKRRQTAGTQAKLRADAPELDPNSQAGMWQRVHQLGLG